MPFFLSHHTHTYARTYIHTRVHTHTHTYTHADTHVHMHTHTCMHTHTPHTHAGTVGAQTRMRSDRKYCIPEGARRAIINYLSWYKTLCISFRRPRQTWHCWIEVATMNNHALL